MKLFTWCFQCCCIGAVTLLSGCASHYTSNEYWLYPPMAVPLQSTIQQEIQIARLSQLLQRSDLDNNVRAKMHYERGVVYDSVGLRDLGRLDFSQSLSLNPNQPEILNLLGVYFTQVGDFDNAYEAFDSCLELDPDNAYAKQNQAIALYYGERSALAYDAMNESYRREDNDPFEALWFYIIQMDLDPVAAKQTLQQAYKDKTDELSWDLVGLMLYEVSEEQALKNVLQSTDENTALAQRLTELYFYLAKRYQLAGDYPNAISLYKLALSFNVYDYIEHRYAFLELASVFNKLRQQQEENINSDSSNLEQQAEQDSSPIIDPLEEEAQDPEAQPQ